MSRATATSLGALAVLVLGLFACSVAVREPWFDRASDAHHFWLTAHTLTVLENWYEEGALSQRFAMLDHPASVELRTLADRSPYVSYPVGFLLPLHAASLVTGERPSLRLIMGFNLLNHLLVALLLAALAFAIARASGVSPAVAAVYGVAPAAITLLTPGPLYWMQNVFFSDQAVMLPFVVAVCVEWTRDGAASRWRRVATAVQPVVLFWGSFTDYLFVFVALTIFAMRWLAGEYTMQRREGLSVAGRFWLPVAAALALHLVHVLSLDGVATLYERALFRTWQPGGYSTKPRATQIWLWYAKRQYGAPALASLAAAVAGCLVLAVEAWWRRRGDPAVSGHDARDRRQWRLLGTAAMAVAPCLAQIHVLWNHSTVHDFSVLKLVVPIALVPWVVFPLAIAERLGWTPASRAVETTAVSPARDGAWKMGRLTAAAVVAGLASVGVVYPRMTSEFRSVGVSRGHVAAFLRQQTGYADIVFSPDWSIDTRPPQLLAIARKRVYQVPDPATFYAEARARTAGIEQPYRVDLLFTKPPGPEWEPVVRGVTPILAGDVRLYRSVPVSPNVPDS